MKTSNILISINEKTLRELTTVIDETVAINTNSMNSKTFKVADLWKIQKKAKTASRFRNWI